MHGCYERKSVYREVNLAYDFGNTGPGPVPILEFPGYVPNTIGGSSGPNGTVGGFTDMPVPIADMQLRSALLTSQTYDGDVWRSYNRFTYEGAVSNAVMALCDIFAGGLTVKAPMALIQTRETFFASFRANTM